GAWPGVKESPPSSLDDSYLHRFDAYIRLKIGVSQDSEQEICLLSCSTFCGRVMSRNGVRAKLCVKKVVIDSSIQAQSPGGFMSQNWRSYGNSDRYGEQTREDTPPSSKQKFLLLSWSNSFRSNTTV